MNTKYLIHIPTIYINEHFLVQTESNNFSSKQFIMISQNLLLQVLIQKIPSYLKIVHNQN